MTRTVISIPLILAPALLLAACSGGADDEAADSRTATGEVLEGSASDAMIPLDSLTSAPPPAREAVAAQADTTDATLGDSEEARLAAEMAADPGPGDPPAELMGGEQE